MRIVHISQRQFVPASHEDPDKPGVLKKVLFGSEDLDPECGLRMVNYAVIQPGEAFQLHHHETLEEVFYILSGKALIKIDDEEAELGSDMAVVIPRTAKHWMKNIGEEPLVYLAFGASREMGKTVVDRGEDLEISVEMQNLASPGAG